jgi:hypothetical protein
LADTNRTTLTVLGTKIRRDEEGRYNLNDCHKAAGGEKTHQPANWLRLQRTMDLMAEMDHSSDLRSDTGKPVSVQNGGKAPGTYVAKELVYDFAMWISPAFSLTVIRAFDDLVTGKVPQVANSNAASLGRDFRGFFSIARLIGLDQNQAALSAARGVKALTGTDPLAVMGLTLIAPQQEHHLTASDIGKELGGLSGIAANQMIAERGYQVGKRDAKGRTYWEPTEKGKPFAVFVDTGKKHSNGSPVRHLRWAAGLISELREAS